MEKRKVDQEMRIIGVDCHCYHLAVNYILTCLMCKHAHTTKLTAQTQVLWPVIVHLNRIHILPVTSWPSTWWMALQLPENQPYTMIVAWKQIVRPFMHTTISIRKEWANTEIAGGTILYCDTPPEKLPQNMIVNYDGLFIFRG